MHSAVCVYIINVDWYFDLHWKERARAVKKQVQAVHLIMAETRPEITQQLQAEGFICHAWGVDRKSLNPFANIYQFWFLYQCLKSLQPDLIHAITIKPNIFTGLMAYGLKIPYLLSVTGTGIIFSGNDWKVKLVRPVIRFLYQLAKYSSVKRRIIFENGDDRKYFIETGLCHEYEAVTILGAGVDLNRFIVQPPVTKPEPVILFAARLLWDKGLGDLVEAASLLKRQGLKFRLQVAGIVDPDSINAIDMDVFETWCDSGQIEWLGTQSNMPELIAGSDIVALPTFYGEGVPRILIEAAACGRAIISSNIAGCREIVQHQSNGLLIKPRDIAGLSKALSTLINDLPLCHQMGLQGRKIVEQRFSEAQVIDETLALYQHVLA